WWVLDPLLQMAVYVILVTIIFQRSIEAYPLFIFSAILPWKWFSSSINDAITSVTARDRIIKQVKFPKIVLPVAAVTGGIVSFAFGLVPLLGLILLFYPHHLSPTLLLTPKPLVIRPPFPAYLQSPCSRLLAGVLQVLPGFGRIYLGYLAIGTLQLLMALCTCGVLSIWSWIDGIVILLGGVRYDGYGRILR
ncbi:MAG: NINE protein, partial [Fimbriimonadales bacterium]|nr:NINE protein [Fimbriimonadales bacterium]